MYIIAPWRCPRAKVALVGAPRTLALSVCAEERRVIRNGGRRNRSAKGLRHKILGRRAVERRTQASLESEPAIKLRFTQHDASRGTHGLQSFEAAVDQCRTDAVSVISRRDGDRPEPVPSVMLWA